MSELIDREALLAEIHRVYNYECPTASGAFDWFVTRLLPNIIRNAQTVPTAPRWVRREEPPKDHGRYIVCWLSNGDFCWAEAYYGFCQDEDKWTAWSEYRQDDVEIEPDYWMPIEPPEEDA